MKTSHYNILVDYQDKTLLFNGLSGALIELEPALKALLTKYQDQPELIAGYEPGFFEGLVKTRCLIESDTDELSQIKERSNRAVYGDRVYELTVNPTMNCNFKCWYCYESHVKSRMNESVRRRLIRHVNSLIEDKQISGLQLGWFGGEPLMTFASVIHPLSQRFKECCQTAGIPFHNSITTNAYLINPKDVARYAEIQLDTFQITLDGTPKQHNEVRFLKKSERPTFDRIVDNIGHLLAGHERAHINLRINFQNKTLDDIEDLITAFPREYRDRISVDFQRVWQSISDEQRSGDTLKRAVDGFREAGYQAGSASNDLVLFQGKKCYADKKYQAVVNYDGNVYKCTARDFKPENREGFLTESGGIRWDADKHTKRFQRAPWERERCTDCSLLPVCMGPCSQQMLEVGEENRNSYCWLDNLELNIEDFVIDRYRQLKTGAREAIAV